MILKEISKDIRHRIEASGRRFHCNDNIADFIEFGELSELQTEVAHKMQEVLKALVIDVENDHNTNDTANRVAKMFLNEIFAGRYQPAPSVTAFPNDKNYDQLYIVGPISIRSTCAHHFQNITGNCWIGVFPGKKVAGLSKYNRLVDWICSRPQIQEEMTEQIADIVEAAVEPNGIAVVVKAEHACLTHRGVKEHDSDMTTSVLRGCLRDNVEMRREFFTLLGGMKGYT